MLKYMEIAGEIEQFIVDNQLEQGTKLPKFNELINQYKVSKSTIVKALTVLESRGVIYQVQGSGVFVRRNKRIGYVNMLENQGFTKDLESFEITSTVLTLEKIVPDQEVCENLHCTPEEWVYYLKRLRHINGQILCLEESYFKHDVVPYLNNEIAAGSVFSYLKSALKLNIGFSDKYLHVGKIDQATSELLELPLHAPGLFVEELFYLTSGVAFDFSRTKYHYEHSQFFLQSHHIGDM